MSGARWIRSRDEGVGWKIALAPLLPISWAYGAGARWNRARFREDPRRRRLPIRVVSVGNLVVGGSGKTPLAAWLAAALHQRGFKVALASRGHGRRRGIRGSDPVLAVSDGRHVLSRAELAGDEPMLLVGRLPGVPVLVGSDRYQVGLRAFSTFGAEVLVLDDGFQHHRLARDVDLVAIDASFGFGNGHVLPRGPLREPLSALRCADAFAVVDGSLRAADREKVAALAPDAPHFSAARVPVALRRLRGGPHESPATLDGASVGLLAGLARPDSLRTTLEKLGARVVAQRIFPDHHRFRPRDLRGLARDAPLWITTQKDAVKITPEWAGTADLRVLEIEMRVADGPRLLDWLSGRLN